MAYANDVFISYSHEDVAWARRLEADLQARDAKLCIFRDETRLYAGDIWRSELQKDIMEAQHLAVVWSDKAKQSGWVNAELSWFLTYTNQATDRKVLCLLLQGTNPAYDPIQMLQELQGKNAYLEDPQNLSQPVQAVWNHEMDRLYKAIAINDPRLPIPYTVVAMTQAEAAGLKGTENIVGRVSRTLADTLARLAPLGLGTLEQLRERYGAQRFDWKPFLGAATIESLLGQLLNQINGLLPASVQFKWEWVDFLTGNMQSAQAAVGKLTGELVLVIVDPLSLYHPAIHAWISLLDPCFERENVIIMTLTPFDLPQMQSDLHDLVRHAFSPTFDFYYDPPVPLTRRIPLCGLNLAANHEVRRLVQFRIGHHPCVVSVQDAPAYITV